MRKITIDSVFVRMLLEGATSRDLNCDRILLNNGISRLSVYKPGTRVELDNFAKVAIEIMQELDDEFLGLTEKPQPVGSFNMGCRACISARNITRSLKRYANFWSLFNNLYRHSVIEGESHIEYVLEPIDQTSSPNNYLVEAILSTVHRFHCWLAGQFMPLEAIHMTVEEPEYGEQYKALFYGAPIHYEQTYNRIFLDKKFGALDIVQTPETLDEYLANTNLSVLYQPKNYRVISDQVRQWLEGNIRHGNYKATLAEAANFFEMSQQVLHRRLREEDLSFKEIKMQTRRDFAINLLFENELKIEEIALRVGFSEPSAFIRAFKSWTGLTPLAYRRQRKPQ